MISTNRLNKIDINHYLHAKTVTDRYALLMWRLTCIWALLLICRYLQLEKEANVGVRITWNAMPKSIAAILIIRHICCWNNVLIWSPSAIDSSSLNYQFRSLILFCFCVSQWSLIVIHIVTSWNAWSHLAFLFSFTLYIVWYCAYIHVHALPLSHSLI